MMISTYVNSETLELIFAAKSKDETVNQFASRFLRSRLEAEQMVVTTGSKIISEGK